MRELTRGEKAKATRIARIGIEAYKAEQAKKGKKGGAKSEGQFKRNPELASQAGAKSKRLATPKEVPVDPEPEPEPTDTSAGNFIEDGEMTITPHVKIEDEDAMAAQLDKEINHINRTQK